MFRDRSRDSVLPWDIIDGGMKDGFFRAEADKAMRAEWTLPASDEGADLLAVLNGDRLSAGPLFRTRRTWRTISRMRSCLVASRSQLQVRPSGSPLTNTDARNVTLQPPPVRRSQTAKPISIPSSTLR